MQRCSGFGNPLQCCTFIWVKKNKTKNNNNNKKPEKAGLVFQKDSFKVAKQIESINAESQFTKEAKIGEAVSSGLMNSL